MGYHFYHFYESDVELAKTLAAFFKEGLNKLEYCMWVPREGISVNKAIELIKKHIPEIEDYLLSDQMRIEAFENLYLAEDGSFKKDLVLSRWHDIYDETMKRGFAMMRIAGDMTSLLGNYWDDVMEYEAIVNDSINEWNMAVVCTYRGKLYKPSQLRTILNNHFCPLTVTP